MGVKRKQHSAEFKARVAMAALSGEKTLAELSAEFGVHPTMISNWKQELVKRAGELFARGSKAPAAEDAQNAIDLGHALGFQEVRVAIMSAMETVNPAVPSTIEAAAQCKMAERGQITGGILDGPLALDDAINEEAAAIKHIVSLVAGRANVLVVPDLEAGNMLAKSLSFLGGAAAAGIVLGARVPIILTSRADSVITRLASCAVASLVADARRKSAAAAVR